MECTYVLRRVSDELMPIPSRIWKTCRNSFIGIIVSIMKGRSDWENPSGIIGLQSVVN